MKCKTLFFFSIELPIWLSFHYEQFVHRWHETGCFYDENFMYEAWGNNVQYFILSEKCHIQMKTNPLNPLVGVSCIYNTYACSKKCSFLKIILLDFPLANIQGDGNVMLEVGDFHCRHGLKLLTYYFRQHDSYTMNYCLCGAQMEDVWYHHCFHKVVISNVALWNMCWLWTGNTGTHAGVRHVTRTSLSMC